MNRCGHFITDTERLPVGRTGIVLIVPVRRCLLCERMIEHIAATEEGAPAARRLAIRSSIQPPLQAADGSDSDGSGIRAAFGPDLEPIAPGECSVQRCQDSCTPSYKLLMRHYGCGAEAEAESGEGCLER